jgi:hypothetical protein
MLMPTAANPLKVIGLCMQMKTIWSVPPNKRLHPTAYRPVFQRGCASIGICRW